MTAVFPPTASKKVPPLRLHKPTGQGYVRIEGRFIYLGRFGLPETERKYHALISEYLAGSPVVASPANQITVMEVDGRLSFRRAVQALAVHLAGRQ